jgi:CBS domain containing-hemolysin-like protein
MMPLLLFLLACAAVYFGTVAACFSALMRLSLRLLVERNLPGDRLGEYLEDPVRLFVAVRVWLALDVILVAVLLAGTIGTGAPHLVGLLIVVLVLFTVIFEHLVPSLLAQRNTEATLDALLPSFSIFARVVEPITLAVVSLMGNRRRDRSAYARAGPQARGGSAQGGRQGERVAREYHAHSRLTRG